MKLLASVCGVIVALAIVGTATGQDGKKKTIYREITFLIDAKTKGVSEHPRPDAPEYTAIKRIEVLDGTVAKKVLLDAKDVGAKEGEQKIDLSKEWVVRSAKIILKDDTVVECQILLSRETGKTTIIEVFHSRTTDSRVTSDKGTRTWEAFSAAYEYVMAVDSSPENIAQTKKDMEGLQGTWRVLPSGDEQQKMRAKKLKVVVKGNTMSHHDSNPGQESSFEAPFNIDPKTKAFDWIWQVDKGRNAARMGIYELQGDDLKIYLNGDWSERPKTFPLSAIAENSKDGWLMVLKREKP